MSNIYKHVKQIVSLSIMDTHKMRADKIVAIRFTSEQVAIIEEIAESEGRKKANFVRNRMWKQLEAEGIHDPMRRREA